MHYNAHVTWIHNDTVVQMTQKLPIDDPSKTIQTTDRNYQIIQITQPV